MAHDLPAVLHAQLVHDWDVLAAADRFVLAERGAVGPALIAEHAAQAVVHDARNTGCCGFRGEAMRLCPVCRGDQCWFRPASAGQAIE
jgi:hypothetical protein